MIDSDKTDHSGRITQSKALIEIINWSADRPEWQRDALRQLISGADTVDIDRDRLEALCVGERDDAAKCAPNRLTQRRIASRLTITPRSASRSSTSAVLSANRWYAQTA